MIDPRTIIVCVSRPLFAHSVHDRRAGEVVDAARRHGHDATVVSLPCSSEGAAPDQDDALSWALVDLADLGTGRTVDAVVCVEPNALFVHHPRKVAWLSPGWQGDERVQRALRIGRPSEAPPQIMGSGADADDVIVAITVGAQGHRPDSSR